MKILVVCQYYYPEPFRITDICETLVKMGHEVTVLTGLPNYPEGRVLDEYRNGKKRHEVIKGVKIIRSYEIGRGSSKIKLFLNYFSFAISASLKALFMKEKFDVVFVNQLSPVVMSIPAIIYKKKKKKKILLYSLDLWPASLAAGGIKENSISYQFFLKVSRWIYSSPDLILVTSSMFKKYFGSTLGIKTEIIRHLPQYAEDLFTTEFNSISDSNDYKYIFVFAGNIGDMQSVETIVKAANELSDYPDIGFYIIGDGSKLEECKIISKSLGLKNVRYYGRLPLSEMPKYYSMADAMLITLKDNKNLSYTLPGKVQSYMAAGKPIIGAINGETRRVIEESNSGLCCAAEDYKGLANIVIEYCNSSEKENMASNSYDYYIENYSKEKFMSILENTLKSLGGIIDV
ncbi:glycosyltransferase family 4 protein [Paraliobacillus zengyii]|uniref:glycosyltransferase family 4 protein n=1 Tax=Paraliobacillus zengyii TaxID=2213194 RepID=UPI000DD43A6D|nr:glycosyltransferase family 4 protein [Paraliobacillus zengyii]